jgi:hypothetical protein
MLRIILRVVLGIVLLALVAGLIGGAGMWIYNAGVTQGLATSGKLAAPTTVQPYVMGPMMGYSPFFFHPWGFFSPFALIPLFLIGLLVFGLFSRLFLWGRFSGGRGPHGHFGRWSGDPEHVPPMVEEWHRRMHGQPEVKTPPQA